MMFLLRDVIRKPNGARSFDDQGLSERGKDPCETAMETINRHGRTQALVGRVKISRRGSGGLLTWIA